MKLLWTLLITASLGTPGADAQEEAPPQDPATEPAATQSENPGGVLDPEEEAKRLAAAELLLEAMLQAYATAPALVDQVKAQQFFGTSPSQAEELTVRLGSNQDAELTTRQLQLVAVDGFFYATRIGSGRYIKVPLQGDLLETSRAVLGAQPGLSIHLRFRYNKPLPLLLHSLTLGSLEGDEVRISSYRRITDNAGQELEELTLLAATGSAVVHVDPETKFVKTLDVDFVPANAPSGNLHIRQHLEFNPEVHEELPTPIAFDAEGLREVRTWKQVIGEEPLDDALVIEKGQDVPDFTLYTLEGRKVVLSALKGKPVVLYFWSAGDVPSRKNILHLGRYVQWLRSEGQPAEFYPVATLSRLPVERRWEESFDTWEKANLDQESLIDLEHEVADAWGLTLANVLVVIDNKGRLQDVIFGPTEEAFTDTLQQVTEKAVAEAADEPRG